MLDLSQVSRKSILAFCLQDTELFESAAIVEQYRRLGNKEKLRVIELVTKPNGYMFVCESRDTDRLFDERIRSGSVRLHQ